MNSLCHRYLNQNILPFIGREEELRRLEQLFHEFLDEGESKYVLVAGPSGGGKTRLVREFEEQLTRDFGETCVILHARYLESNVAALTPILNGFEACLNQQATIKDYLQKLGLLRRESSHGTLSVPIPGKLNEGVSGPPALQVLLDSLSEIAKRFPFVLVLEDIQNMDDLPVFDQFFLGLSSVSKFVVLTERRELPLARGRQRMTRSFEQVIREVALREERTSDVLFLSDFEETETRQFLRILFELEPSGNLVQSVHSRTAGRPLSLRTMLRQLVSIGILLYEEGHWTEDPNVRLDPPSEESEEQEVLARFQREVERLNPDEQTVAIHAALLGEQFDLRLLRRLLTHRLGTADLSEELFQRTVDLLTFKSIIRRATPSISFLVSRQSTLPASDSMGAWCFEFSHAHFWNTILDGARECVTQEYDLPLAIVWIAGAEHLPLYSSAFLSIITPPYALATTPVMLDRVEHFLLWSSEIVRSLASQEPQQCFQLLLGIRPLRDELTWRFGRELSERAISAHLDLHTLLVEAYQRNGQFLEAERDLEHAIVLERFIQSSRRYDPEFQSIAHGRIAVLRAILCAGRTSYGEFERWSFEARNALAPVSESNIERAYLLTILNRAKAGALLNAERLKEADALIEAGMPDAQLLAESRFEEYSLYYGLAVNSKLKQDQNAQAGELTRQIMELAKEHGNTLIETMFLFQAALAAFSFGDLSSAMAHCELGIANGRRYGIRFVEIMCNLWRMIIAGVQQDAETVKECSQQLAILVEDARVVAQSPNLLQRISLIEGRATAMNFLGRHHAALEFAEEAIQLASRHQHDSFAAWAQNEKALAYIGLGQFEEALTVAHNCVELAGEQRLAERTARTALIMAYAGLGRFEEARHEASLIRNEFKERNPYYFRFARAETRLTRLLAGQSRTITERMGFRQRIELYAQELIALARAWNAPLLEEQIYKEFEDVLPRRESSDRATEILSASETIHVTATPPLIRLYCFGSMTAEPLRRKGELVAAGSNDVGITGDTPESSKRESKVRQLIALLVVARTEALEPRMGRPPTRALARETLLELLWPDSDASSLNALYSTVKRARAFLGTPDAITLTEDGYLLHASIETDCEEALRHYNDVRQARKRNALFSITFHYEQMMKITGRGPFMEGLYGTWLDGLRTRMSSLRHTAAVRLIEIELERGLLERAEEVCLKVLAQDEFDEEALRGLLIINARRRQTTKLIRLFDDYSKKLKSEFRTEPSLELLSLYRSLVVQA